MEGFENCNLYQGQSAGSYPVLHGKLAIASRHWLPENTIERYGMAECVHTTTGCPICLIRLDAVGTFI
jgi:hypothetical protein